MNRHDWLKIAGLLGLGATGLGMAGVGPLAALGAGAKGATLGAGLAGPTTAGAGGLMGIGNMIGKAGGAVASVAGPMQAMGGLLGPGQRQQVVASPAQQAPIQTAGEWGYRGAMPPELMGLPPDDPRVIAWRQRHG